MKLRHVIALALVACATSSHALYANVTPPSGFSFVGGALRYGGTPAATMNWVSGASGISTSTSFIGRNFAVGGTARLAPLAGQAVARALVAGPIPGLATAAAVAAWFALSSFTYDSATQNWTVPGPGGTFYSPRRYDGTAAYPGPFGSRAALAAAWLAYANAPPFQGRHTLQGFANADASGPVIVNYTDTVTHYSGTITIGTAVADAWCIDSAGNLVVRPTAGLCPGGAPRVITQTDADAHAAAHPMPDAVAKEAQKVMPLPVLTPELQPLVQPIGSPRDTPEGRVQDRVRIEPANDPESPWRVEQTVETVPEGTSNETPGEEKPIDPCDAHPERVGCQTLEAPDDPGIPSETRTITYTADNLGFGSGCPAPRNFMFHGWALPLDYTPLCNVAPTIRLGLIAITALGCILIIIGVTRS